MRNDALLQLSTFKISTTQQICIKKGRKAYDIARAQFIWYNETSRVIQTTLYSHEVISVQFLTPQNATQSFYQLLSLITSGNRYKIRSHIVEDGSGKETILGTQSHHSYMLFLTHSASSARILITFVISQVVIVLLLAFCVFFSIMLLFG